MIGKKAIVLLKVILAFFFFLIINGLVTGGFHASIQDLSTLLLPLAYWKCLSASPATFQKNIKDFTPLRAKIKFKNWDI